jgi:uncharacterized membrane protein HdeD (DUF308 family)
MSARLTAAGSVAASPRSERMSAGLVRNWRTVGLRAIAAAVFVLAVVVLPSATWASLVLMFTAYLIADGIFAIIAGARAGQRGERWWPLMLEGTVNLAAATVLLAWPAIAVTPFIRITSAWALVTGALLIAAARRLSGPHGRWLLVLAGALSAGWGVFAAAVDTSDPRIMELWLVGYAVIFGATLVVLTLRLQGRHRDTAAAASGGG